MKIAIIQPWIRQGGAESLTVHLASSLRKLKHQVKIITLFTKFDGLPSFAHTLEYVTPNKYFSKLCGRSLLFRLIFGGPLLFLMAMKSCKNVDLINSHNFPSNWIAVIVGVFCCKPTVWTCNEPPMKVSWETAMKIGIQEFFIGLFAQSWFDKKLVKKIKKIIVLDKKNQKRVKAYYRRGSTIINTGIDFNFYRRLLIKNKTNIIKKYNLEKKFILLAVGKLVPQKNQTLCLDCLKKVVFQINNAVLIIIGDGSMRKVLEQRVRDLKLEKCVRFTGFISNEELRDLYHLCHINLFPAVHQSWGMTPFEALCAKKISIVSSDCGAAEVVSEQNIGMVSRPNPTNFSENIVKIHNNPQYYQNIAQRGFNYVKENMSWEQYAKKTHSTFLQAINKNE